MKKYFFLSAIALSIISCGGGSKEQAQDATTTENTEATTQETAPATNNDIKLTGNDQMQFDLKEMRVKSGEKVKLTLTHAGIQSKETMGHNFVLLKSGTDVAKFATDAISAKDNDYIPKGTDAVIAHTKTIGGGETTSIEFDAPAPGTYDFICSFPGHYAMMQGKFIVE